MVTFTCNHCGDSIKKQAVEKHYNTKCRGAPYFVSCMDCSKDFAADYTGHIKCISEAEKYSSKDYVPRAGQNKGERKQLLWVELIRSIIQKKADSLDAGTRMNLQKLENFDNVPQKAAKFKNFLKNSLHLHQDKADVLWNLLDEAVKADRAAAAEVVKEENKEIEKPKVDIAQEYLLAKQEMTRESNLKYKLKKKAKRAKQENAEEKQPPAKKQKKVSDEHEDTSSAVVNGNGNHLEAEGETTENGADDGAVIFQWNAEILKILKKKPKLSEEKLQEKVLKKYQKFTNDDTEISPKILKKFNKKLKKLDTVLIYDGVVTLV